MTGDEKLAAHRQTRPLASPEESVGDLALLLRDPRLIAEVPADKIPTLIGDLERLKAALWTRLCVPQRIGGVADTERLVDVKEAAHLLILPTSYIYELARLRDDPQRPNREVRPLTVSDLRDWIARHRGREADASHGDRAPANPTNLMACIRKRRGEWVVDYRDGAGKRRWGPPADAQDEAKTLLDEKARESRQGRRPVVDPDITVGAYAKRWLRIVQAGGQAVHAPRATERDAAPAHPAGVREAVEVPTPPARPDQGLGSPRFSAAGGPRPRIREALARDAPGRCSTPRSTTASSSQTPLTSFSLGSSNSGVPPGRAAGSNQGDDPRAGRADFLATAAQTGGPPSPRSSSLWRAPACALAESFALQWPDLNFAAQEIRVERGFSRTARDPRRAAWGALWT